MGLVLHNIEGNQTKYFILNDNASKLRAVIENKVELDIYKSYKDVFEYYLKETKDDISGMVGKISIASYYDKNFMDRLQIYFENKKFTLSKPNLAYTKDVDKFFDVILNRYVGERNINKEISTITARKYMKNKFEETNLIDVDKKNEVDKICDYINAEGEIFVAS